MFTKEEVRDNALYRYVDLPSDEAKKAAYERFAWDFVNNKPLDKTHEEIIEMLSKHWFDVNGSTYLGTN